MEHRLGPQPGGSLDGVEAPAVFKRVTLLEFPPARKPHLPPTPAVGAKALTATL